MTSALGVNHGQLSRWRREVSPAPAATTDSAFVELPTISDPALPCPGIALTLTRQSPAGGTLSVSGQLSEAQWHWALRLLQEQDS